MTFRYLPTALVLGLGMAACQPTFSVERHRLGPFRLAALGVVDGRAEVAVWSGDGPTHAVSPQLAWRADGDALGEGFGIDVPPDTAQLELELTAPDGTRHTGSVSVSGCEADLSLTRATVETAGPIDLDTRRSWTTEPTEHGASDTGEGVRLTAQATGFPTSPTLRWMVAGRDATVLEVDETAADLLAERIVLDGDELESRSATGPALHHGLALAIDSAGCNRWQWFGVPFSWEPTVLAVGEARLTIDGTVPDAALVSADLWISDGVPELSGLEAASAADSDLALPCGDGSAIMDPAWMWSGRCARDELHGARVLLEVQL